MQAIFDAIKMDAEIPQKIEQKIYVSVCQSVVNSGYILTGRLLCNLIHFSFSESMPKSKA